MKNATMKFYPNKDKQNKRKLIPIYMRICLDRKKAERKLNIELTEGECLLWNEFSERVDSKTNNINSQLQLLKDKFENGIHQGVFIGLTEKEIAEKLMCEKTAQGEQILFLDYIKAYYDNAVANNSNFENSTKRNYRKANNAMEKFLVRNNLTKMNLKSLNVTTAFAFKDYLLTAIPEIKKIGMDESSALGIFKKFRTIIKRAIMEELVDKNPFCLIKFNKRQKARERLNISEVMKLQNLNLKANAKLIVIRDVFMFMVFTGLAYKDVMNLTGSSLIKLGDGNILLRICRGKSGILTEVILVKYAIDIINRYSRNPEALINNTIFPRRSNQKLNDMLKVLAEKADIQINLTSHVGRHTYRQLLGEAGVMEHGIIKRMMGHSNNDIDGTYYMVTESRLTDAKQKFELYLDKSMQNGN